MSQSLKFYIKMGSIQAKQLQPNSTEVSGMVPMQVKPFEAPISSKFPSTNAEKPVDDNQIVPLPTATLNPGTYAELHKLCKDVQPTIIDGANILINNSISNHFQTAHRLSIINCVPYVGGEKSGYKFSTTFVGDHKQSGISLPAGTPIDSFPILYGEIDTAGSVTANVVHHFAPEWRVRCSGQFINNAGRGGCATSAMGQLTGDWLGHRSTSSLTLVNLNRKYQPEVLVVQHLHALTANVAIGGELYFNNSHRSPETIMMTGRVPRLTGSGAVRVQCGPALWTATSNLHGVHLCAYRKCSESLSFGVESEVNWTKKEAKSSVAFQVDGGKRSGGVVFRGRVDTAGRVGSVLEKRLDPLPVTFSLSALIHHGKHQFRLGCALILNR